MVLKYSLELVHQVLINNNYNRAAIGRSSDGSTQVESGNGSGNTGVYLTKVNLVMLLMKVLVLN